MVPAFEKSCKAMFEQVDAVFQKGMSEHTAAAQQQSESTHTPLAVTLRVRSYIILNIWNENDFKFAKNCKHYLIQSIFLF